MYDIYDPDTATPDPLEEGSELAIDPGVVDAVLADPVNYEPVVYPATLPVFVTENGYQRVYQAFWAEFEVFSEWCFYPYNGDNQDHTPYFNIGDMTEFHRQFAWLNPDTGDPGNAPLNFGPLIHDWYPPQVSEEIEIARDLMTHVPPEEIQHYEFTGEWGEHIAFSSKEIEFPWLGPIPTRLTLKRYYDAYPLSLDPRIPGPVAYNKFFWSPGRKHGGGGIIPLLTPLVMLGAFLCLGSATPGRKPRRR